MWVFSQIGEELESRKYVIVTARESRLVTMARGSCCAFGGDRKVISIEGEPSDERKHVCLARWRGCHGRCCGPWELPRKYVFVMVQATRLKVVMVVVVTRGSSTGVTSRPVVRRAAAIGGKC